ncbi:MAG: hypothetical protein OEZ47_11465 [Gammaproteobacteria bacterium]|nr:hypothetical protein [Gammaproteobacteria bacterium]
MRSIINVILSGTFLVYSAMSFADGHHLTLDHVIVSSTHQAQGTEVTFEFTIKNETADSYHGLTLTSTDQSFLGAATLSDQEMRVNYLPPYGNKGFVWTINSPLSDVFFSEAKVFTFLATAKTEAGKVVAIPLVSSPARGGVK